MSQSLERIPENLMTPRWTLLRPHPIQSKLWRSKLRFRVVPSGRRSGKTEIAKRFIVQRAMEFSAFPNGRFVCGAPTKDQAREIFWDDLKALIPTWYLAGRPNETRLEIRLINGAKIQVVGLDKPERVEGGPLDGIILDEYGNMKKDVWEKHVRPALGTPGRLGWAWFIGVPEGRNHYWTTARKAQLDKTGQWGFFWWESEDILDAEEIASAKAELDPLTYDQEYRGKFVSFAGRVYYTFEPDIHGVQPLEYNPKLDLTLCFDFNIAPGTALVLQEQKPRMYDKGNPVRRLIEGTDTFTAVIDEVWVNKNSNTPLICKELIDRYRNHQGEVYCYGDPSGGAGGTAKVKGSDWDLIEDALDETFGDRLSIEVDKGQPRVKARINAVNSRLRSTDDRVHMLIDPKCEHTMDDLEGVMYAGETMQIDKKDLQLTHLSDALGYYMHKEHRVGGGGALTRQQL